MDISYRNDGGRNLLVVSSDRQDERDFGLRMLERHGIPGFLKLRTSSLNGKIQLLYDITSLQPFARVHDREKITGANLEVLFNSAVQTRNNASRYMVDGGGIVYAPDLIFVDPDTHRPSFLYLPESCRTKERSRDPELLSAFIIRNLDHGDPEAIRLGYGFYSCVQNPGFSFADLDRRLQEIPSSAGRTAQRAAGAAPNPTGTGHRAAGPAPASEDRKPAVPVREKHGSAGKPGRGGIVRRGSKLPEYFGHYVLPGAGMAAACCLIIFLGGFDLTQAGGLGFLFIAVFWLIHSAVSERQKKNKNRWAGGDMEEEDRLLEALLNEVYEDEDDEAASKSSRHPGQTGEKEGTGMRYGQSMVRSGSFPADSRGDAGSTQILAAGRKKKEYRLISRNPDKYPDILIEDDRVVVGKKREQVDVRIPNADLISRIHAQLTIEDGRLMVEDLNSTNGTYVNGRRIEGTQKTELQEGDIISFASASYKTSVRNESLQFREDIQM